MKYTKLFNHHSDYLTYIEDEPVLPNLSMCKDFRDVHYNPIETRVIVKYNITNTSANTQICAGIFPNTSEMYIDDILIPKVTSYMFSTTGEHIVKYSLIDKTKLADGSGFQGCLTIISVIIPDGVTTLGTASFYNLTNLTTVYLPDSLTIIPTASFNECTSLTNISIPENVTTIGQAAFYNCSSLTSIVIPANVTTIDSAIFYGCSQLSSVTVLATTPPSLGEEVFKNNASGRKIYVPAESVSAYKAATNWSYYASDIEAIS